MYAPVSSSTASNEMKQDNIFSEVPPELTEELTESIARNRNIRIERIISKGHKSADGFWYDQDEDEWVLLLQGAARLQFEHETEEVNLSAGDHMLIPARTKHRVSWTDPDRETIWLALFSKEPLC